MFLRVLYSKALLERSRFEDVNHQHPVKALPISGNVLEKVYTNNLLNISAKRILRLSTWKKLHSTWTPPVVSSCLPNLDANRSDWKYISPASVQLLWRKALDTERKIQCCLHTAYCLWCTTGKQFRSSSIHHLHFYAKDVQCTSSRVVQLRVMTMPSQNSVQQ